jgi:hypothetical protein
MKKILDGMISHSCCKDGSLVWTLCHKYISSILRSSSVITDVATSDKLLSKTNFKTTNCYLIVIKVIKKMPHN